MAVDIFLKIEGIDGESKDAQHTDEMECLSYSFGGHQSGTMHSGTGGGSGKVSIQDLTITKYVDKGTPNIFASLCSGKHQTEATLTLRKAGDPPVEYLIVKMKKVLVSGYSVAGSQGDERTIENISLNFEEVRLTYTPQADDGSAEAEIITGWNIAQNEAAA